MGTVSLDLYPLFNPQSVAVIGASANWNKWGNSTFSSIVSRFKGRIYPVNKKEKEILGYTVYKSVLDIPEEIDLAVFVIPAESVPAAMEECVIKGVKTGIIISAGFRETGPDGLALEQEVIDTAKKGGLRFVGPNCMGLWSATSNLSAYMFPLPSMDGPAVFITQGGNVGGAIVGSAFEKGLGLRAYISCGPAADIQLEDYIEYFAHDDDVKVIMLYIEGMADGRRFTEKAREVSKIKPVVVYKPGRSGAARKAILSHSGTFAGSDDIFDMAMRHSGVIRVDSPEELLDVSIGLLTQPLPAGPNVGIITGGGSYGVICAEDCESRGLVVPELPEETITKLSTMFPPRWSRGNPVDPAGDRNFIAYYLAPGIILELDEIDSLVFMGFGSITGISSLFDSGGPQIFVNRIPELLGGIEDLEGLCTEISKLLRQDDAKTFHAFIDPLLPFIATLFGSDTATIGAFTKILVSGPLIRNALVELIEMVPSILDSPDTAVERIFSEFDILISRLLSHYISMYRKPIISTTFQETSVPIRNGAHPFASSTRATTVLAKMLEYREFLNKNNCSTDAFRFCSLLNDHMESVSPAQNSGSVYAYPKD